MDLAVATRGLTLRYITDDLAFELARLAAEGIHDPAVMPFEVPWNDVPPPELERNTLWFYRRSSAETTVGHWDLQLCALVDDVAVGMCSVAAADFAVHRSAETARGSGGDISGRASAGRSGTRCCT